MSRADEHAQDLAEFLFFEDTTTDFTGLTNLQEILDDLTNKTDGVHLGTTSIQFADILAGAEINSGILTVDLNATLVVDGESYFTNTINSIGLAELDDVDITGTLNTFGDVDFNDSTLDFSTATIVGFPANPAVLPNWTQVYRYSGTPASASQVVGISRAAVEGKELVIVVYDPNNVDEMSVLYTYFPNIGNNMPTDHIVNLASVWDDGGGTRVEYQNNQMNANGTRLLLVLARDPIVFPVGGIGFDVNTAITWSNT
jgi:hypothetical protein